jgi:hypothetical protein
MRRLRQTRLGRTSMVNTSPASGGIKWGPDPAGRAGPGGARPVPRQLRTDIQGGRGPVRRPLLATDEAAEVSVLCVAGDHGDGRWAGHRDTSGGGAEMARLGHAAGGRRHGGPRAMPGVRGGRRRASWGDLHNRLMTDCGRGHDQSVMQMVMPVRNPSSKVWPTGRTAWTAASTHPTFCWAFSPAFPPRRGRIRYHGRQENAKSPVFMRVPDGT